MPDNPAPDPLDELVTPPTHGALGDLGLVMGGGGARAAYQVGVLKAVAQILPPGTSNPFPIISGASAGAINAAALAVYADNFSNAVRRMERVWGNFHVHHVFRTDVSGMVTNWTRWWAALLTGGPRRLSMFNRAPLRVPWRRDETTWKRWPSLSSCRRMHMTKSWHESLTFGVGKATPPGRVGGSSCSSGWQQRGKVSRVQSCENKGEKRGIGRNRFS